MIYEAMKTSSEYTISVTFNDDPHTVIEDLLVTELHYVPDGYTDDKIFFYGLNKDDAIKDIGKHTANDFVIVSVDTYV